MSELEKKYNEVIGEKIKIGEKINLLEKTSEEVKEYLGLLEQIKSLNNEELDLYESIKEEEYDSCEHVLVCSEKNFDIYNSGATRQSCGCIKCGLDNSVLNYSRHYMYMSLDRKIMYDYLRSHYLVGIETKISCDLDLAQAIYSKIKETYPGIDDETVIIYFKVALDDIRNIKVSHEREISRAKRLSLNPEFSRWNAKDIRK